MHTVQKRIFTIKIFAVPHETSAFWFFTQNPQIERSNAIFQDIRLQAEKVFAMNGIELEEINYGADHARILFSAPPQARLSSVINNLKSTTSRLVRKNHAEELSRYYWKPYFRSRSYLILSSGGAPIEVIRKYIQEQGTEEHMRKKEKVAAITT